MGFNAEASRISGRTTSGWIVGDRLYAPALLITATQAWSLPGLSLESLDAAMLPALPGVELLLLGTGAMLQRPTDRLSSSARARGWRIEAMDSPAAARTFNILVAEERLIGALIL